MKFIATKERQNSQYAIKNNMKDYEIKGVSETCLGCLVELTCYATIKSTSAKLHELQKFRKIRFLRIYLGLSAV